MNRKVTSPIKYLNEGRMEEHIQLLKDSFEREFKFIDANDRPTFYGKPVHIEMSFLSPNGFPQSFIHLIGFDAKDVNFDEKSVLACANDESSLSCDNNCLLKHYEYVERVYPDGNTKKKYPCLYRGARIVWINQIIKLADSGSPHVRIFEESYYKKGIRQTDIHLRYTEGIIDYDVILIKKRDRYILKSAFPVIHSRKKKDLDRKYTSYLSQI